MDGVKMGVPHSNSGFQFDAHQPYQLDAIAAVVELFDGQPKDAEQLSTTLRGAFAYFQAGQSTVGEHLVGWTSKQSELAVDSTREG
ncbi:hypothetical protein ACQV5M_19030, partial [Leptospira sp. SA-E8]|uniref:hypothetical protein n=1 Tax=Leptospira sp. SA-E8 TaxID=3422259 RepID=UPI003EBC050E